MTVARPLPLLIVLALSVPAAAPAAPPAASKTEGRWIPLFNGKDLTGWTPKIRGQSLGENFGNTFRVKDGLLKVSYDQYDTFGFRFGHLAYRRPLSHYRLRIEYRFVGQQIAGAPAWALRNSGVMLHGQPPASMEQNQDFPVSIEVQFLGGTGTAARTTANVCTPGTHLVMDGKLVTKHCTSSRSPTIVGDAWVTVEVEVRGNRLIRHLVNGRQVLTYSQPQLDDSDKQAKRLLESGVLKQRQLDSGYIYLQAESHPVEFRKIELLELAR